MLGTVTLVSAFNASVNLVRSSPRRVMERHGCARSALVLAVIRLGGPWLSPEEGKAFARAQGAGFEFGEFSHAQALRAVVERDARPRRRWWRVGGWEWLANLGKPRVFSPCGRRLASQESIEHCFVALLLCRFGRTATSVMDCMQREPIDCRSSVRTAVAVVTDSSDREPRRRGPTARPHAHAHQGALRVSLNCQCQVQMSVHRLS